MGPFTEKALLPRLKLVLRLYRGTTRSLLEEQHKDLVGSYIYIYGPTSVLLPLFCFCFFLFVCLFVFFLVGANSFSMLSMSVGRRTKLVCSS